MDVPGHMTNKKRYIAYSPRPVAIKLDKMLALDKGKFYTQHAKCTRSLSSDYTDLAKSHYVLRQKGWLKRFLKQKNSSENF